MGFKTLTQRVAEKGGIDANQIDSASGPAVTPDVMAAPSPAASGRTSGQGQLPLGAPPPRKAAGASPGSPGLTPISLPPRRLPAFDATKLDTTKYETIATLDRLQHWIARAYETGVLALKTETSSLDPMQTALCGLALAVAPNEAAYLPLGHREANEGETSELFASKL